MIEDDIHVQDMIEIMSFLEPTPPITAELDKWKSKYPNQKEHMMGWFLDQPNGSGNRKAFSYTRRIGNESSKVAYNRFLNPGGLLWMAEALGEEEDKLREAIKEAIEAEKVNYRIRCNAFRKVIPFERIIELLNQPDRWKYDDRIYPLLEFDEEGQPFIKEECEDQYMDIIGLDWA